MNSSILQKCLEELKAEEPDISYVRGMLETLIAVDAGSSSDKTNFGMPKIISYPVPTAVSPNISQSKTEPMDEAAILDARARAAIETVKSLTQG